MKYLQSFNLFIFSKEDLSDKYLSEKGVGSIAFTINANLDAYYLLPEDFDPLFFKTKLDDALSDDDEFSARDLKIIKGAYLINDAVAKKFKQDMLPQSCAALLDAIDSENCILPKQIFDELPIPEDIKSLIIDKYDFCNSEHYENFLNEETVQKEVKQDLADNLVAKEINGLRHGEQVKAEMAEDSNKIKDIEEINVNKNESNKKVLKFESPDSFKNLILISVNNGKFKFYLKKEGNQQNQILTFSGQNEFYFKQNIEDSIIKFLTQNDNSKSLNKDNTLISIIDFDNVSNIDINKIKSDFNNVNIFNTAQAFAFLSCKFKKELYFVINDGKKDAYYKSLKTAELYHVIDNKKLAGSQKVYKVNIQVLLELYFNGKLDKLAVSYQSYKYKVETGKNKQDPSQDAEKNKGDFISWFKNRNGSIY